MILNFCVLSICSMLQSLFFGSCGAFQEHEKNTGQNTVLLTSPRNYDSIRSIPYLKAMKERMFSRLLQRAVVC